MKNNRQEKILAIIEAEPIETQEQLLSSCRSRALRARRRPSRATSSSSTSSRSRSAAGATATP